MPIFKFTECWYAANWTQVPIFMNVSIFTKTSTSALEGKGNILKSDTFSDESVVYLYTSGLFMNQIKWTNGATSKLTKKARVRKQDFFPKRRNDAVKDRTASLISSSPQKRWIAEDLGPNSANPKERFECRPTVEKEHDLQTNVQVITTLIDLKSNKNTHRTVRQKTL